MFDFIEDAASTIGGTITDAVGGGDILDTASSIFGGDGGDLFGGIADTFGGGDVFGGITDAFGGGDVFGGIADAFGGGDVIDGITDAIGGDDVWGGIGGIVDDWGSFGDPLDGIIDYVADPAIDAAGSFFGVDTSAIGGAIDWATSAIDDPSTLVDTASGFLGGDAGNFIDGISNTLMGGGLGEEGFGGLATMGLDALDSVIPGASTVGGALLGGADPASMLSSALDGTGIGEAVQGALDAGMAATGGGFDLGSLSGLGQSLGIDIPDNVDDFVGALGAGNTGDLLQHLGDAAGIGGFVDSLGDGGASTLVNSLVSDGTFGDFLGQADGGAVQDLIGKLGSAGDLESIVSQLDPSQTADLVSKLVTAGAPGAVGDSLQMANDIATAAAPVAQDLVQNAMGADDDLLGAGAMAAATGAATAVADDALGAVAAATDSGALGVADDPLGAAGTIDDVTGIAAPMDDAQTAMVAGDALGGAVESMDDANALAGFDATDAGAADVAAVPDMPDVPDIAPPEPDAFDTAIQAADQAESSVDDMFNDLG
jgi:hypothetical protein